MSSNDFRSFKYLYLIIKCYIYKEAKGGAASRCPRLFEAELNRVVGYDQVSLSSLNQLSDGLRNEDLKGICSRIRSSQNSTSIAAITILAPLIVPAKLNGVTF